MKINVYHLVSCVVASKYIFVPMMIKVSESCGSWGSFLMMIVLLTIILSSFLFMT